MKKQGMNASMMQNVPQNGFNVKASGQSSAAGSRKASQKSAKSGGVNVYQTQGVQPSG